MAVLYYGVVIAKETKVSRVYLEISTAAFDGYSLSTKDATHKYVPERQVQLSK